MIEKLEAVVNELGADFVYRDPVGKTWHDRKRELEAELGRELKADTDLVRVSVNCKYVHQDPDGENRPGCIAGRVMLADGATYEDLKRNEAIKASIVADNLEMPYDEQANTTLHIAQTMQDRGFTYGEALERAKMGRYPDTWPES
jgi:hypothetical protein